MYFDDFFEIQNEAASVINRNFTRYLFANITWDSRLIGIVGARGVGKTTLLLQHYKKEFQSPEECLYISADNILVAGLGLFEIGREFFKIGGKTLIIDEIHKYKNWSQELKNLYDSFPKGQFIISGSSTLGILKGKGDLSRRLVLHELKGLSFREYLNLQTGKQFKVLLLEEILNHHVKIAGSIGNLNVIKHFKTYLTRGYYPFYLEGVGSYHFKIDNIIEKIIYEDIPSLFDIKPSSTQMLKKIIYLVATSAPFSPNIEKISSQIKLSKEYVYNFLEYLERTKVFTFLFPPTQGFKLIRKPEKIYFENSNIIYAIVGKHGFRSEIGTVRETFFINQLTSLHTVFHTPRADFLIDDKYTVEVGGRNKDKKQIYDAKNAFIASDDIDVGSKNRVPLWLFGFLY